MSLFLSRPPRAGQRPAASPPSQSWWPALLLGCATILMLGAVAWPLADAWFSTDDYTLLALARHTPNPALFFFADPFSNYMYRPVGMLLWWLSGVLFGTAPTWHYAFNMLLHAAVAAALGLLVYQATGRARLAFYAAMLFALHPGALKAATWLSDRFDLLATLSTLLCLAAAERALERRRGWWLALLMAAIAAFSKEIAFLLAPALALRLWGDPRLPRRQAAMVLAIAGLPFVLVASAHHLLLADMGTQLNLSQPLAGMWRGAIAWLVHWPDAIAGAPLARGAALAIGVALAVLLLSLAALVRAGRIDWRWAAIAALMMLGPMLVQAPVFQLVLVLENPLSLAVNFRFYYFAGAGLVLALFLVAGVLRWPRAVRGTGFALVMLVAAWSANRAYANMQTWADGTGAEARRVVEAAIAVARTMNDPGPCTVFLLDVPSYILELPLVSDAAVKSALPRGHRAMGCVFLTERSPTRAFTAGVPCEDGTWHPLAPRAKGVVRLTAKRFGTLCIHNFDTLPPELRAEVPRPYVFTWRGGEFREGTAMLQ